MILSYVLAGNILIIPGMYLNRGLPFGCLLSSPGKKGMSHPNEVIHPINALPTNWYGEHFGYLPHLETGTILSQASILSLSTMEDPPLKHILVNKVEDIAHRQENTDLIVSN